ncbi:hypothetical protein CFP56_025684, partial [Quercus suber]
MKCVVVLVLPLLEVEGLGSLINQDVLQNIQGRLPGLSSASTVYISKSWNRRFFIRCSTSRFDLILLLQ